MSNVNNIAGLTLAIQQWTNRNDQVFIDQIPLFISLAEQEFFIDCSTLGNEEYDIGNFGIGSGVIPRPALWGQSISFLYVDSLGNIHVLERVPYEYIRTFIDNQANAPVTLLPRYYTDYGYGQILIAPTPQAAYKYEFIYFKKITPLSISQPSNWITQNAYDCFFWSCLHKAYHYLHNNMQAESAHGEYSKRLQAIIEYQKGRIRDRSSDAMKG